MAKKNTAATADLMYEKLAESGLTKADAKKLGFKFLTPAKTVELTENKSFDLASFQIPYYEVSGKSNCFWRARLLETRKSFKKKAPRYTQPRDQVPKFYLPPITKSTPWKQIAIDPTIPLLITEGELKPSAVFG
jgi:hypothetical protein